jgi:hypothetical protein
MLNHAARIPSPEAALGDRDGAARHPYLIWRWPLIVRFAFAVSPLLT